MGDFFHSLKIQILLAFLTKFGALQLLQNLQVAESYEFRVFPDKLLTAGASEINLFLLLNRLFLLLLSL